MRGDRALPFEPEHLLEAPAADGQDDLRAWRSAEQALGRFRLETTDTSVIDRDQQVAGADPGGLGRRAGLDRCDAQLAPRALDLDAHLGALDLGALGLRPVGDRRILSGRREPGFEPRDVVAV